MGFEVWVCYCKTEKRSFSRQEEKNTEKHKFMLRQEMRSYWSVGVLTWRYNVPDLGASNHFLKQSVFTMCTDWVLPSKMVPGHELTGQCMLMIHLIFKHQKARRVMKSASGQTSGSKKSQGFVDVVVTLVGITRRHGQEQRIAVSGTIQEGGGPEPLSAETLP